MDIITTELKTMKIEQLRRLIQETVQDILNENIAATVTGTSGKSTVQSFPNITAANDLKSKNSNVKSIVPLEEDDINEFARPAEGFKLADENMDMSPYTPFQVTTTQLDAKGRQIRVPLSDVLEFIKENPGTDKKSIFMHFKLARPQQADKLVSDLFARDILIRMSASGVEKPKVIPGEEEEPEEDVLAQYFDSKPNKDGSEDFTDDEEPEMDGVEKAEPILYSDIKTKAANFIYDNDRLIQKIINAQAASKTRIREVDDNGMFSGDVKASLVKSKAAATSNLPELIQQLVDKIKAEDEDMQIAILNILEKKFGSVGYSSLHKRIAKELGIDVKSPTPVVVPKDDDEEEEDEYEPLDEWTIRKMQYYAGIK